VLNSVVALATNPKKQAELKEEARDLLRSTPKGLETPKYTVERVIDGPLFLGRPETIELRSYEPFTVARTRSSGASGLFTSDGAEDFNTLAAYLFGKNEVNEAMAMTMPVTMSEEGMSFVLPRRYADAPPAPLAGSDVTIDTVPSRLVAVKPFAGLVTEEEVRRQTAVLREAINNDGSLAPTDTAQVSVLQYNSPLTLPWRRRNEVAMVVSVKMAQEGKAAPDERVVSWYDSGVRL